jgi:hypothetical protein
MPCTLADTFLKASRCFYDVTECESRSLNHFTRYQIVVSCFRRLWRYQELQRRRQQGWPNPRDTITIPTINIYIYCRNVPFNRYSNTYTECPQIPYTIYWNNSNFYFLRLLALFWNKKFWEEVIAYFPSYDTSHIENDASKNSSIVMCVFVTAVTFLPIRCLATIKGLLPIRFLATIGGYTHIHADSNMTS